MGVCFSCKRSKRKDTLKTIRVVHLNGSLEDYEDPATVDQVISNFPKHFLCSPIQILQIGLVPLRLDHQLKIGQIYFMLPNSTLRFNASPIDLTSLTRKLTNIAKTSQCVSKSVPTSPSTSPLWDPQARSPGRVLDRWCGGVEAENIRSVHKSPPWKPILATIKEISSNQRSESVEDEHFDSFYIDK